MTSTTTNLGLTLYDAVTDAGEFFLDFRDDVAGTGASSNMNLIDDYAGTTDGRLTALEANVPLYYSAGTDGGSGVFTSTISGISAYTSGLIIVFRPTFSTSNNVLTINVNSLGAKNVKKVNASGTNVALTSGDMDNNRLYLLRYDGTEFVWVSSTTGDTISVSGTNGNFVKIDSNGAIADSTYSNTSFASATHASAHISTGGDPIPNAVAGGASGLMSGTDKTKLNSVSTGADVTATALGGAITGATGMTTPDDDDVLPIYSISLAGLRKISWANIKTTLESVFANLSSSVNLFTGGVSAAQGGAIRLGKPASGTTLSSNIQIDVNADKVRIFDVGGSTKGAFIDIASAATSVGSEIALKGIAKIGDMIVSSPNSTIAAGTTSHMAIGGAQILASNISALTYVPYTMNITSLSVRTSSTQSGTGSLVIDIFDGASSNLGTLTIPAGSASGNYTTSITASVSGGGFLRYRIINNAGAVVSANIVTIVLGVERLII